MPKSSILRASIASSHAGSRRWYTASYTASVRRATVFHSNCAARACPRSDEALPEGRVREHGLDRRRELARHAGVDEERRVAGDLGDRARASGDDRRAGGHRLQHGQPEALVERREHEAGRARVERRQIRERHVVGERNGSAEPVRLDRAKDAGMEPGAGAGEHELGRAGSRPGRRRTSAKASIKRGQVLARLEVPDEETIRAPEAVAADHGLDRLGGHRARELGADRLMDHDDLAGRHARGSARDRSSSRATRR